MKKLSVDIDKVINETLAGEHSLGIKTIICDANDSRQFAMLKEVSGDWIWLRMNAAYATEHFDGDESWRNEKEAIRAAMLENREVIVFETLLEFCQWYISKAAKS